MGFFCRLFFGVGGGWLGGAVDLRSGFREWRFANNGRRKASRIYRIILEARRCDLGVAHRAAYVARLEGSANVIESK